jgi:phage/plasmid-associated DNA primase
VAARVGLYREKKEGGKRKGYAKVNLGRGRRPGDLSGPFYLRYFCSERNRRVASAGYEHPAFTNINDWDSDGWLFNCENGVIDLRTQTFRGRTPSDLCMKQSPIVFDPDAQCPLWEAAMNKWMCGNQSLIDYLQISWGVI